MLGTLELERDFRVMVRFRPVLPLAVRQPSFFSADDLKHAKYIRLDWPRRAERLGMPHAWPSSERASRSLPPAQVNAPYRFGRFELNPAMRQLLADGEQG